MRKLEIKIADRGLQCRTDADHPDGTFGTIYTTPPQDELHNGDD